MGIYTGETQISAEDVNRFIEAAQELKIKGLIEVDIEISDKDNSPDTVKKKRAQSKEPMKITHLDHLGDESSLLDCSLGSEGGIVQNSNQFDSISETVDKI